MNHEAVLSTLIVFSVLFVQTIFLGMTVDKPDFQVVLIGFVMTDIASAMTYIFFRGE